MTTIRHPIRGLLIGPLIAPIAYWLGVMMSAWARDFSMSLAQALRELAMIAAFGLPVSYAAAIAWGAPLLFALRRLGWLRADTLIAVGALGGTIVAALLALGQQGSLFQVKMPLSAGAALGALASGLCWLAGQGKEETNGTTA